MKDMNKPRKSKFKNEQERIDARNEALKKAAYKYQKKDQYKEYKKQKYREHVLSLIKLYIEKKDKDDLEYFLKKDLTAKDLRNKFKKKYGEDAYNKYLFKK